MTNMFERVVDLSTKNPHLPHNSTEIAGTPPADAATTEMAMLNADLLISQIMQEESVGAVQSAPRQYAAA